MSSTSPGPSTSIANSSPPSRATVHAAPSSTQRQRAIPCSTTSPASWPWTSLMDLNQSTSMRSIATTSPSCRDRSSIVSTRLMKPRRLGSPVRDNAMNAPGAANFSWMPHLSDVQGAASLAGPTCPQLRIPPSSRSVEVRSVSLAAARHCRPAEAEPGWAYHAAWRACGRLRGARDLRDPAVAGMCSGPVNVEFETKAFHPGQSGTGRDGVPYLVERCQRVVVRLFGDSIVGRRIAHCEALLEFV